MTKNNKSLLTWVIGGVIIAVIIFAALSYSKKDNSVDPQENTNKNEVVLSEAVNAEDWSKGTDNPKITIVEYSDFQCPACKNMSFVIEDIMKEFNQHIKFVYRHFPLTSIHQNALIMAQVGEAAGLQGKFWEMHDTLFANQETWSKLSGAELETAYVSYATEIGLDLEKFKLDVTSSAVKKRVKEGQDQAKDMKLNSTPTLFIDGVKIENIGSYQAFRKLLSDKLLK